MKETRSASRRSRACASLAAAAGVSATFTVRKISNGVGVERIFPTHSPMLADVSVVRRGRVRRAKLFYLRELTGKASRIKEKKVRVVVPETTSAS